MVSNPQLRLRVRLQQRDGRFRVIDGVGNVHQVQSSAFAATNGAAVTFWFTWGNALNPTDSIHVYQGAYRTWLVLKNSNRMLTWFTDIRIRFGGMAGNFSRGVEKLIEVSDARARQGTIHHEMGHIASYLGSRDQSWSFYANAYCFLTPPGTECVHDATSQEHGTAQFEEGFANFVEAATLYQSSAVAPRVCRAGNGNPCGADHDVEATTCNEAAGSNRWEISVTRYLWDIYDSRSDYAGEGHARPFYEFIDTIYRMDNGAHEQQKDEPWDWWYSSVDDTDGRSAVDFRGHLRFGVYAVDSQLQWETNCSTVGDW